MLIYKYICIEKFAFDFFHVKVPVLKVLNLFYLQYI